MKNTILFLILSFPFLLVSQNYVTNGNGTDFSDPNNWDCDGNAPCLTAPSGAWNNVSIEINDPMSISGNVVLFGATSNIVINDVLTVQSRVNINNSTVISGTGKIATGGDVTVFNGSPVLGVEFEVGGDFNVSGGTGLSITKPMTIVDDLNITGGYGSNFTASSTVVAGGDLNLSSGSGAVFSDFAVGGDFNMTGSGGITSGDASFGGDILITNGGYNGITMGNVTGGGVFTFNSGGASADLTSLTVTGDFSHENGGLLTIANNMSVNNILKNGGTGIVVGGDLNSANIDATGNSPLTVQGDANVGDIVSSGGTTLTFEGNVTAGDISVSGNSPVKFNGPTADVGNITATGGTAITGSSTLTYTDVTLTFGGSICGRSNDSDFGVSGGSVELLNCGITLPIELAYFEAGLNNGVFEFSWETFSEENNDFFTIQYSNDGMNFYPLANVDGAGNSNETLDYTYFESELLPTGDVVYFKLVQTDFDGTSSESYIVPVSLEGLVIENGFSFYPNPVNDFGHIKMTRYIEGEVYNATIINILTYSKEMEFVIEEGISDIDLTSLIPGVYLVKINGFDNIAKIVVE